MKQTINEYDFVRAFETMGRAEQFSYDGLKALFEYLEEYEQGSGEELELDVIALCCDFAEYENFTAWQNDYFTDEQIKAEEVPRDIDELRDETTVISVDGDEDGRIIVGAF